MRSFSVVPDEPRDQLAIELIGSDQQLLMVINELLLNGPVKTFDMGVHLGSSGIGMPMSFVQASDLLIQVLHELRAVIGKNGLKRVRKNISDNGKELSGSQDAWLLVAQASEARIVIGKCDHVTSNTIEKILHRVEGSTLAGSAGFVAFGFSALGTLFPLDCLTVWAHFDGPATHLIGLIGDNPTDGSRFRTA